MLTQKPTRFYSKKQETKVAKTLGARRTSNSGATMFDKGDVSGDEILVECKTLTQPRKQHTIKKEWLDKNEEEAFAKRKALSVLAFDFGDGENYYIVKERDFVDLYQLWLKERGEN